MSIVEGLFVAGVLSFICSITFVMIVIGVKELRKSNLKQRATRAMEANK